MIGMRALLLLSAALLGNPVAAGEIEELQARANQGDAVSQAELGLRFAEGDGVEQEFGQAFHWWTLAANQGDALAQRNLGVMYAQGDHVAQDYTRAVYWYTLAANQGSVRAQFDLGVMYREGAGILIGAEALHQHMPVGVCTTLRTLPLPYMCTPQGRHGSKE